MLCYLYSYYPKQYRPPDFSQKMPFRLKYVKWTVRLSTVTQRTEILQEDFPNLAPGEASLRSIRRPALEADRDGKGMIPRLTSITNTKSLLLQRGQLICIIFLKKESGFVYSYPLEIFGYEESALHSKWNDVISTSLG